MSRAPWGFHLVMNAAMCDPTTIRSRRTIDRFARQLVKRIDMVPYGAPQIVMFGSGNKKGYTLIQLIETSNISAHFVEETNDLYLDVFSCKEFEKETVVKTVQEFFAPLGIATEKIVRDTRDVPIDWEDEDPLTSYVSLPRMQ